MTKKQLNEYKKRFAEANELGITVQEILLTEEKIRGIYGIYKIDGRGLENCIYPALSRADNETMICPDCGTREALESIGISPEEQEKILEIIHGRMGQE